MNKLPWVAALCVLACTPPIRESFYSCDGDRECPDGWFCNAGLCESEDRPEEDAGAPDAGQGPMDAGSCEPVPPPVDVLVVVDNSISMAEEQIELARVFPDFLAALVRGDSDLDGTPDTAPVRDLHLGVITPDLGVGPYTVMGCTARGDDAALLRRAGTDPAGCDGTYPPFFEVTPESNLTELRHDFSCVARAGTTGCGFEQQLEASLKAITPSTSSIRFGPGGDEPGVADTSNAGFWREGSVKVLLIVTDEDDCSLSDWSLADRTSATYAGVALPVRCIASWTPDPLHAAALRYGSGFRPNPGDAERFVFAVIAGLPPDLEGQPLSVILDDPRMQPQIVGDPPRAAPACGAAAPAERLVELARELEVTGSRATVHSICSPDFGNVIRDVLAETAPLIAPACPK